jgi:hypothetical protein
LTGAQQLDIAPVERHGIDLVAPASPGGGLEDQFGAVKGKIRLSVLTLEGELANVPEMDLLSGLRHVGLLDGNGPDGGQNEKSGDDSSRIGFPE